MREELSSLHNEQEPGHNLTFGEHIALMNLKEDNSLVINKADKGSTIVVQNHSDYAQAGFIHLSDTVEHAMNCPSGSFPSIRHNEVRDLTSPFLSEVCHNVRTEPTLQPLQTE